MGFCSKSVDETKEKDRHMNDQLSRRCGKTAAHSYKFIDEKSKDVYGFSNFFPVCSHVCKDDLQEIFI